MHPPSPAEEAAFERVEQELATRHPELSEATVSSAVRKERARLADSRVRDFLPLLVQRAAAARLSSGPAPGRALLPVPRKEDPADVGPAAPLAGTEPVAPIVMRPDGD